ncbi:MAG: AAA family ATPase [bacterium]|nr:AAA family ATPase [bacterium]
MKEDVTSKEILDELNLTHYGLDKVKDMVMDYIYAYSINPKVAKILCLYGPPGVGKTSIAKSIASALRREFIKISLAGCGDSTYLLGTSRVYVNSSPGAIVRSMFKMKNNNPVFLMDEIDKTYSRYGNNSVEYALLDILDKDNNHSFRDHFIEEEYSLQNVMFICTANDLNNVTPPLLNRMEVIRLDPYDVKEKSMIATNYLIPSILGKLNLDKKDLPTINQPTLTYVINRLTLEGGARILEKRLERMIISYKRGKIADFSVESINNLFKDQIIKYDTGLASDRFSMLPGRALGLYVSGGYGGGVMSVDVSLINIRQGDEISLKLPKLELTGNISNVMKESVRVALMACLRLLNNVDRADLVKKILSAEMLHVHYSDTAVSKDGPSAGLATSMAIMSIVLGEPLPY